MMSCSCSNLTVNSAMLPLGPFKARVVCVRPTHIGFSFWKICCRWSIFTFGLPMPHAFTRSFWGWRLGAVRVRSINSILFAARLVDTPCVNDIPIALRVSQYTNISRVLCACAGRLESRWCLRRDCCLPKSPPQAITPQPHQTLHFSDFHLRNHVPPLISLEFSGSYILSSYP